MPNYQPGAAGTRAALSDGTPGREPAKKVWRVIHACEYARDVLPVIETQISAGMRPFIVTPQGAGAAELYLSGRQQENPRQLSLLREWQDVRNWRKSILDCDPESSADVVHAHSFAAGMAAVRNCSCVVYDVQAFIEELAISTGQCEAGSWMARSFRVAEQFILARAAALVVHSRSMAEAAHERGAPRDSIFVIPDPLPQQDESVKAITRFSSSSDGHAGSALNFFLAAVHLKSDGGLDEESQSAIKAFRAATAHLPLASLVLIIEDDERKKLVGELQELSLAGRIRFAGSMANAWELADVVIAPPPTCSNMVELRRPNTMCIEAMMRGKAVIAADTPENRDVTPDGRGCLWYTAGDLAARMVFMAENPGFRSALGHSAAAFIQETRGAVAVGRRYEEAYRHAVSRRRVGGHGNNAVQHLLPATQAG